MGNFASTEEETDCIKLDWVPDIKDNRDNQFLIQQTEETHLPKKIDLRDQFSHVSNNGKGISSSVSNGIASLIVFDQGIKKHSDYIKISRLFLDSIVGSTNDRCIRNYLKVLNKKGVCEETLWPHREDYKKHFPYKSCFNSTKLKNCIKYKRLDNTNLETLKQSLFLKRPFIFGFSVYSSFFDETVWNPKIDQMPTVSTNEKLVGGHTAVAVGYSNKRKCFIIRNCWGKKWGLDGYFFMPYKFIISDQCADFWNIETIPDDFSYKSKKSNKTQHNNNSVKKSVSYEKNETVVLEKPDKTKDPETIDILIPKKENAVQIKRCIIRNELD
tara:strand:+ start:400 stop:1383 length:984 start_codon:yes stop_codon:yes gene_type:complete